MFPSLLIKFTLMTHSTFSLLHLFSLSSLCTGAYKLFTTFTRLRPDGSVQAVGCINAISLHVPGKRATASKSKQFSFSSILINRASSAAPALSSVVLNLSANPAFSSNTTELGVHPRRFRYFHRQSRRKKKLKKFSLAIPAFSLGLPLLTMATPAFSSATPKNFLFKISLFIFRVTYRTNIIYIFLYHTNREQTLCHLCSY